MKNALDAIVDEMAIALVRTAYSNNLKNAMDMSCALCDADGRLIAQGLTLPLHLGSIPDAMAHVRRKFAGRTEPGDVFILNDPFEGGTHLPDFYIFKPIFLRTACARARAGRPASATSSTSGGKTPGGNGCDATEIYQEGLRIPPLKLYERGQPVEAIFELIDRNVRVPRQVLGDVRSQVAACLTGERGYLGLVGRARPRAASPPARRRCSTRPSGSRATPSPPCPTASTPSRTAWTTTASIPTPSPSP